MTFLYVYNGVVIASIEKRVNFKHLLSHDTNPKLFKKIQQQNNIKISAMRREIYQRIFMTNTGMSINRRLRA